MQREDLHRWGCVLGLALGIAASIGFARFAYGLILPAMQADQDWSYAQAGWINTANALGYLGGAFLTLTLVKHLSPERMFSWGVIVTAVSLVLSGLTQTFALLTLWRIASGLAGAAVLVSGSVLVGAVFADPKRMALAVAIYFGGAGFGMVLTGATLPALFAIQGPSAWPAAWIGLGVASGIAAVLSIWAVRNLGRSEIPAPALSDPSHAPRLPVGQLLFSLLGYGLFASGSIIYLTFLVVWMQENAAGPALVSVTWITIGLAVVVSPLLWRSVLMRFDNGVPLALAIGVTALGALLPLAIPGGTALIVSALFFGLACFTPPAALTAFSRRNLPPQSQGAAMALFTIMFATGQTIGPVAGGALGDLTGSIKGGLVATVAVLVIGTLVALRQRSLPRSTDTA
ncbi:MAG: YbfB/YjiJ family MFS transporter [Pseudomonadota bacterium]